MTGNWEDFPQGFCRQSSHMLPPMDKIFSDPVVIASDVSAAKLEATTIGAYHYALYALDIKIVDVFKYEGSKAPNLLGVLLKETGSPTNLIYIAACKSTECKDEKSSVSDVVARFNHKIFGVQFLPSFDPPFPTKYIKQLRMKYGNALSARDCGDVLEITSDAARNAELFRSK
jgi:hypothetical protein